MQALSALSKQATDLFVQPLKATQRATGKVVHAALIALSCGLAYAARYPLAATADDIDKDNKGLSNILAYGTVIAFGTLGAWGLCNVVDALNRRRSEQENNTQGNRSCCAVAAHASAVVLIGLTSQISMGQIAYQYNNHSLFWAIMSIIEDAGIPMYSCHILLTLIERNVACCGKDPSEADLQKVMNYLGDLLKTLRLNSSALREQSSLESYGASGKDRLVGVFQRALSAKQSINKAGTPRWAIPVKIIVLGASSDSEIFLVTFIANRHPVFWNNPEKFNPERFMSNEEKSYDIYAFGNGKRNCLGRYLADTEVKLAVLALLKEFQLSSVNSVTQVGGVLTQPNEPILLRLQPRRFP